VAGAIAAIDVAPNSFRGRVILKVTRPDLAGITSSLATLGWVNAEAVAGIGVDLLSPSGQALAPALAKPVTVTLCGPAIGVAGEQVLALTGPTTATEVGATVDFHCVRFSVGSDANLAVVNPRKGRGTPRAGESDSSLSLTAPSGPVGHEPVLGVAPSGSAAATVGEAPATAVASRQTGAGVGKVERDTGSRTVTPSGTSSGDASTRSVASAASLSVVEGGRGTGRATSATLWLGVLAIALFLAVVALIAIKRLRAARL
jgi:hypothetical protein